MRGECVHTSIATTKAALTNAKAPTANPMGFPFPPDTRPAGCRNSTANLLEHKVAIIIPWFQEKWEHMDGTLRSILHFTPDELVEEIIFVSDGNKDTREGELRALSSKVKVLALPEREGLIRAKMMAVKIATAPVLLFMEAHCIVNRNWLPPLLDRLLEEPRTLAMPVLDAIPMTDWNSYHSMPMGHWRFEWNMNLVYTNPGEPNGFYKMSQTEPFESPATSGGIFAMRKDWFEELRLFDEGMLHWGGDHVELSMKVWRCGGRIEIVPCARMGHLFRDPANRPYDVEVMQVVKNYNRLAQIWWSDHLELFYSMKPEAKSLPFGSLGKSLEELKTEHQELGCKNHDWYIEHVDHEMNWEKDRICHPYAAVGDPIRCSKGSKALASGRWTLERQDLMPLKEFLQARAAAKDSKPREVGKSEL